MANATTTRPLREHARDLLLVAVGGGLGALTRYGFDVVIGPFLGTITVNVVGAFLLALLAERVTSVRVQLLAGTGFLSSFTTYSTLVSDAVTLGTVSGTGYVAISYGAGFAAAAVGLAIGRHGSAIGRRGW